MALTSSLHTMSSSTNSYLLQKANMNTSDNQMVDILLHGQTIDIQMQIVNRWCKSPRRPRLNSIVDVSQRYDVLLSLINILQHTSSTEYQFNFLTLISELQGNISHYDQEIYVPGMFEVFLSAPQDKIISVIRCVETFFLRNKGKNKNFSKSKRKPLEKLLFFSFRPTRFLINRIANR